MQLKWLWVCLGMVVLVAAGGGGAAWYFVLRNTPEKTIIGKWQMDAEAMVKQLTKGKAPLTAEQEKLALEKMQNIAANTQMEFRKGGTLVYDDGKKKDKWKVKMVKGNVLFLQMENESKIESEMQITVIDQDHISIEVPTPEGIPPSQEPNLMLMKRIKSSDKGDPAPKENPRSTWTPDPALAGQLTHTGGVAPYSFLLPTQFKAFKYRDAPGGPRSAFFTGNKVPGRHLDFFSIAVINNKNMLEEGKKNPRQALVDHAAAFESFARFRIDDRGVTENGVLDRVQFYRFQLSGVALDKTPVKGWVYVAFNDNDIIMIFALADGTGTAETLKLLESSIATFSIGE
jgi:hypothetical protein